jgi:chemotaxis protein CheZ
VQYQYNGNRLYEALGELARFVENAMRTITEVGCPIISSSAELPAVASHLADLSKMTEDGALEVMRLTEMIQDHHSRSLKELGAIVETLEAVDCATLAKRVRNTAVCLMQNDKCLTEIMTALSFQDLVAQRVKKLMAILNDVQDKLLKLVVAFGLQNNADGAALAGNTGELLKQFEESKTTAMKQNVADEILAQFGFK